MLLLKAEPGLHHSNTGITGALSSVRRGRNKMPAHKNYVPHNEILHIETRRSQDDWDDYLNNLSKIVGEACDKWLASRGIEPMPFIQIPIRDPNKGKE